MNRYEIHLRMLFTKVYFYTLDFYPIPFEFKQAKKAFTKELSLSVFP